MPRPPSLRLPAAVTDLTATRVGDRVHLQWTGPARTTDGLDLTTPTTVEICRDSVPLPPPPQPGVPSFPGQEEQSIHCTAVMTLAGHPGASMAIDQLAPPWTSPASPRPLVAYRVRTLNPAGRSTAPSPAAFVLAGPPLPVIAGFHAQQTKEGVVLEWPKAFHPLGQETVVEILRTEPISASTTLSPPDTAPAGAKPPPKPAFKGLSRSQPNDTSADVHLRQGSSPLLSSQPGQHGTKELDGMIDRSALQGKVYLYSAQRVQVVPSGAKKMEIRSEPTPPTTVVMRDTFPPAPPKGLVSVPGTTAGQSGQAGTVDLAWEPNTEPDLAGYFVYRTDLTEGTSDAEPTQLNASPIPASTYRDGSVLPRHRYVYRVAAVDRNGNVSALSSPEDAPEVR